MKIADLGLQPHLSGATEPMMYPTLNSVSKPVVDSFVARTKMDKSPRVIGLEPVSEIIRRRRFCVRYKTLVRQN